MSLTVCYLGARLCLHMSRWVYQLMNAIAEAASSEITVLGWVKLRGRRVICRRAGGMAGVGGRPCRPSSGRHAYALTRSSASLKRSDCDAGRWRRAS